MSARIPVGYEEIDLPDTNIRITRRQRVCVPAGKEIILSRLSVEGSLVINGTVHLIDIWQQESKETE